ncbi:MAG: hypothetical protein BWX72_00159 [Firmicutes bacterium ADurb.Bin080]|nr:MAG: hypothetical protein BWX72_00159 [Firmicutes bacterium ADurb.Bin080]
MSDITRGNMLEMRIRIVFLYNQFFFFYKALYLRDICLIAFFAHVLPSFLYNILYELFVIEKRVRVVLCFTHILIYGFILAIQILLVVISHVLSFLLYFDIPTIFTHPQVLARSFSLFRQSIYVESVARTES